ncbi:MAG: LPS export ABC transporter ATP-binding protein [Bdellovibrionales bacterium]|nr:LPS export ABC transporter ATP-binding protein [Bdellovibrionales bacterium]
MEILKGEGLSKTYGKRTVVSNVSVSLQQGSVVGLLGPNGAGKTTVFYMMVGLVFPGVGRIFVGDREVTSLSLHERARLGIGYLPQEPSLFRKLSVRDNVVMALESKGFDDAEISDRAQSLLKRFGLEKVATSPASALSGGERRRCEIARCLAIEPRFVLLDEPFAGIDPIAVGEIQGLIQELKANGIGVLITDHNVRETLGACDTGYLMRDGEIFFTGTPQEITDNPEARKFYLGDQFRLS